MSSSPKRVLFLSHKLNLSGVARHLMALSRGLRARGWEVGVVARDLDSGTPMGREWFSAAGFRIFQAPFPLYGLTLANARAAAGTLAVLDQIVKRFRPDVLHVHAPTLCPWVGIVGWQNRVPTVSTLHLQGLGPNKVRLARMGNRLLPKAFGQYSIAVSSEMAELLISLGMPSTRVRTIVHGAEDERFRPPTRDERAEARRAYGLGERDRVVCCIALLEENKRHDVLVRAVAELRRRGLEVIALCAGESTPADLDRISRQAQSAGVADLVRLLGHQDSRRVMWASDASVLLSSKEAFGIVIVESMLCGLVPLRTPGGGAADQILDASTGFLIPFGDHRTLADRLQFLFTDNAVARRMSCSARTFARAHFTRAVMAERTEAVYLDAIRECRPRLLPFL